MSYETDCLMAELEENLRELGIPLSRNIVPQVRINTRAKRRLGCCYYQDGVYAVEVSAALLEQPERLRQTLVHELLHTCPGCRNHGKRWKSHAAQVNEAFGYSIERTVQLEDDESGPLRKETVKYVLDCQSCGIRISRTRMSKAVKSPWQYRCKCGGKLKRIQ